MTTKTSPTAAELFTELDQLQNADKTSRRKIEDYKTKTAAESNALIERQIRRNEINVLLREQHGLTFRKPKRDFFSNPLKDKLLFKIVLSALAFGFSFLVIGSIFGWAFGQLPNYKGTDTIWSLLFGAGSFVFFLWAIWLRKPRQPQPPTT